MLERRCTAREPACHIERGSLSTRLFAQSQLSLYPHRQIDVKIFSNPDEIFPLMHDVISSYPSYETDLSPRLILGLWHPLFIAPAQRYLPSLTRFHIGLSTHIARKYFWDHMDGFSIAFPMLTSADGQAFLRDCKAAGKGIMTWTVNEERDMQVARTYGVEWLITDRVGFAVEKRQEVGFDGVEPGSSVSMSSADIHTLLTDEIVGE